MLKRLFDILLSLFLLVLCMPFILLIALAIKLTSKGPVFYWSDRVGQNNVVFSMPKFRTMDQDAPSLPTRAMEGSQQYITAIGSLLRKTSLDEIPQFWSILKGDMSFVGPRPVLLYEADLLELRTQKGVHKVLPGLTGWAQINGRDRMTIEQKVLYDQQYVENQTFLFDTLILLRTIPKVLLKEGITH